MTTKRIQRRDENIARYRAKGMTYRAIGKMFKLSHTRVMQIIKKEMILEEMILENLKQERP